MSLKKQPKDLELSAVLFNFVPKYDDEILQGGRPRAERDGGRGHLRADDEL
jgi:hypothetical protein